MKILELPVDPSVKETLQSMLDRSDHFQGVIVIALNKDESQFMMTSNMNAQQKSFLMAFAQNFFLKKWFDQYE